MGHVERIVEEISSFLHTYLKAGVVNIDSFSQRIHAEIDEFERLFIVRFLLHDDTKKFVRHLPSLLRNFKTMTTTKKQKNIAEVRGAIDWPETVRERMNENYQDTLTFVTNKNLRSYNTHENIVLKRLLKVLYHYLYNSDYIKTFYQRDWFQEWKQLRENVYDALRKNIYLQRVSNIEHLSRRTIQNTMKHRNPLYREAAKSLYTYERFLQGQYTEEELQQLLRETFILPKEEDVLFELYWIAQFIKQNSSQSRLHLMDGQNHKVASWEQGPYLYSIYHDSSGPKHISFQTRIDELKDANIPYVRRIHDSFEMANVYGAKWFQRDKTQIFRRDRPDFLVVKKDAKTDKLVEIIIGEVKNTTNIDYAMTGLRELIDYMHLAKYKGEYIDEPTSVKGILCVRDLPQQIQQEANDPVQVVTLKNKQMMGK